MTEQLGRFGQVGGHRRIIGDQFGIRLQLARFMGIVYAVHRFPLKANSTKDFLGSRYYAVDFHI